MPPTTNLRSHKRSRWANALYQTSLICQVVLITIVLLATGYDIGQQVVVPSRGPLRFSDTAITAGGYLMVGIGSAVIAFSRLVSVRKMLLSIPKGYMPIGRDELSKNMYPLTTSEYTRCALIVDAIQPKGIVLPGWGAPGTDYAGVYFRKAIIDTLKVLETVLPKSDSSLPQASVRSRRTSPLSKFLPLFAGEQPLLPKSTLPLLQLYEKHLEDAMWGQAEPTQEDYETCLRIVAVVVDIVGKRNGQKAAG